ncbi:MAG: signal recognition particle-docking protein FtsY, partial [Archaeoglobaceae archaeon]
MFKSLKEKLSKFVKKIDSEEEKVVEAKAEIGEDKEKDEKKLGLKEKLSAVLLSGEVIIDEKKV